MIFEHSTRRDRKRAANSERVSGLIAFLHAAVIARRTKTVGRFRNPTDWRRLVALGLVVTCFAVLELANIIMRMKFSGATPGTASIFGGLLLCIIIVRISQPTLYADWIVSGAMYIWLGMLLTRDPTLSTGETFVAFSILMLASALLRIWIGTTIGIDGASAWLVNDGLTGIFFAISVVVMRLIDGAGGPALVLVCDLMCHGISIAFFGRSLGRMRL